MRGIDLFSGGGGTTLGATSEGVKMLWAANHNPVAVETHQRNHPETIHVCQDLHQANWAEVPKHDMVFASPCCQGHSKAAGKKKKTLKADKSRSTAWAVVSCLEAQRSEVAIIENVKDFMSWTLFKPWVASLELLGYALSFNTLNARDFGIPQNRERLFIVATRTKSPIKINWEKQPEKPASSIIDWEGNHVWDSVSNRVEATQNRVKNGRERFGDVFLDASYGSELGGRSIHKPLGTVTTVNKHSIVVKDKIRPLSTMELAVAQSFPRHYHWPKSKTQTKNMIGNAVPPQLAATIVKHLKQHL